MCIRDREGTSAVGKGIDIVFIGIGSGNTICGISTYCRNAESFLNSVIFASTSANVYCVESAGIASWTNFICASTLIFSESVPPLTKGYKEFVRFSVGG